METAANNCHVLVYMPRFFCGISVSIFVICHTIKVDAGLNCSSYLSGKSIHDYNYVDIISIWLIFYNHAGPCDDTSLESMQ